MKRPPIFLNHLKENLQILVQDEANQIRLWTGQTDVYVDFVETVCGLFDDSGFTSTKREVASAFLGEELTEILIHIGNLTDTIDYRKGDEEIARTPQMADVRKLAQKALKDPIFTKS